MKNLLISQALAADTVVDIETPATAGNFFGFTCIANLVSNIVSVAFILASIAFFVFLVWGGIEWLMSGGDKGKIEMAQKRITSALIGLIIIAASYAIYKLVLTFIGIDLNALCTTNPVGP
ncbi:MAG: hypothetical protein UW35_C0035G0005 [Candidatus Collierbacteria bacterium GW2011_GWF2_44_15]|uniref:Uncharacterized protein n=5 Tax=Patescibacteria group TaxID=1783273 RepID=A0A0G1HF94_9BACT|nr:MAG: hypothetical protein UR19_C0009G0005 [Candidatus Nomurabacteria bacterium GW2011_GWF1_31_48]KKT34766.1 MAG: hypothetical protein UW23_C0029G0009 [Candidatus Collierbacteria bacterium GW2011_GWA1_44_12]KKT45560.1 MAG: hypothetical protein UW35_C0035G0005 [Candidatus Collierbacteria bacterium GW2011_GWF2_44_15]KKT97278.1 MAG: hypothetical protein UW99_C0036G0005 [Candidatus Collierbacteria bacterium GW2011_GWC2_45_15]KKU30189.1 MAG: hypothetical protein UX41_C0008G0004 [Candidatus Collier